MKLIVTGVLHSLRLAWFSIHDLISCLRLLKAGPAFIEIVVG